MRKRLFVKLDKHGRIRLPKSVRAQLGLLPGDEVVVELAEVGVILTPVPREPELINKRGLLVVRGELIGDIENLTERDREERIRQLSAGWKIK